MNKKLFYLLIVSILCAWGFQALAEQDDVSDPGTLYPDHSYDESVNPREGSVDMKPDLQGLDCQPNCKAKVLQQTDAAPSQSPSASQESGKTD